MKSLVSLVKVVFAKFFNFNFYIFNKTKTGAYGVVLKAREKVCFHNIEQYNFRVSLRSQIELLR